MTITVLSFSICRLFVESNHSLVSELDATDLRRMKREEINRFGNCTYLSTGGISSPPSPPAPPEREYETSVYRNWPRWANGPVSRRRRPPAPRRTCRKLRDSPRRSSAVGPAADADAVPALPPLGDAAAAHPGAVRRRARSDVPVLTIPRHAAVVYPGRESTDYDDA